MPGPIQHHLASGIHPGAFVQNTAPITTDVLDHVLWVDTSSGPPYQMNVWDAGSATWLAVGAGVVLTACLTFLSHGASICNEVLGKLHFNTPSSQHTLDATGYQLPAGHRLEQV